MFDWSSISKEAGGEVVERYFHETLSQYIKEGIANGDNTHNILFNAIRRLRNSKTLLFIQNAFGTKATGLALTGIGAGIAAWMQKMDWGKFMPEEKNPVMHQIRFALQNLAPRILVGGAEALGDNFEDHLKASVSEIVSDDSATSPMKPGSLDRVAYLPPYGTSPADIFEYEYDVAADGTRTIRTDRLGLPCCKGAKFQALKQERIASVKRIKSKTIPGQKQKDGKDGQSRTVDEDVTDDEYKKLCFLALNIEDLPIADAIRRMEFTGTDPATISLLLRLTEPKVVSVPKKVETSSDGLMLMRLLTQKVATRSPLEQKLIIDLVNDIAQKPEKINHLGEMFLTDINRASGLSDEDYFAIRTHLQLWLGSTLTFENKVRLAIEHAKHVFDNAKDPATGALLATGERFEMAVGTFAQTIGRFVLASAIGFTALFAMFLGLVLLGAFGVSLTRPIEASSLDVLFLAPCLLSLALAWNCAGWTRFLLVVLGITTGIPGVIFVTTDVMERLTPNEFAVALVAGGGILACLELFSFTAIQGLLSLVTRFFPNLEKDWLVNKGRILIMFIAIHVGIFMILLSVSTPWLLRLVICVPTFFALASQMGLSGYDFGEEARLRARKTMRLFSALTTLVFIAVVVTLVCQLQGKSMSDVLGWIMGSRILQSVLILSGVGFVVAKIVRLMEIARRRTVNGIPTEILYRTNWWLRAVGIILVLGLASWPWIGSDINAHYEKKTQASSPLNWFSGIFAPLPVVQQGVSNASVISQPVAPAAPASSRAQQKKPVSHSRSSKMCESLGYSSELCARARAEGK